MSVICFSACWPGAAGRWRGRDSRPGRVSGSGPLAMVDDRCETGPLIAMSAAGCGPTRSPTKTQPCHPAYASPVPLGAGALLGAGVRHQAVPPGGRAHHTPAPGAASVPPAISCSGGTTPSSSSPACAARPRPTRCGLRRWRGAGGHAPARQPEPRVRPRGAGARVADVRVPHRPRAGPARVARPEDGLGVADSWPRPDWCGPPGDAGARRRAGQAAGRPVTATVGRLFKAEGGGRHPPGCPEQGLHGATLALDAAEVIGAVPGWGGQQLPGAARVAGHQGQPVGGRGSSLGGASGRRRRPRLLGRR